MKTLTLVILFISTLAQASVIPVNNSQKIVTDELFSYQWGLMNQGQTLIREKDDIHNLPLKGVVGKDIAWKGLLGKFGARRPIVAVLDSGVDLNHPELQGNLWKNLEECGKDQNVDNDGNQLKGDCHGWNFTEDINSDAAKDPSDIDGHGTHISGIIAALNNGTGMVGVVPHALIMPIKVMKDSNSQSTVPSSEAFALGIRYAVDNGADVINMSLGWPQSLETKKLTDAVYYALANGVAIVAAAGNNNSSEPLYPCAYDGVICVAASTVDGSFASFSNYGGHVDTIAPGEGILGLNPMLLEPEFFAVPGFELRSGTSQAAPLVTGLVAQLKSLNKDITIDEIFAKIYQSESLKDDKKYILGGEATWSNFNAPITSSIIRPIFKNLRRIVFQGNEVKSSFDLRIRNFGKLSEEVKISVESLSEGVSVGANVKIISSLEQGKFKDLNFEVNLKDDTKESNAILKVTITQGDKSESFTNEIPVMRDLRGASLYEKNTFHFKGSPLPVGGLRNGQVVPLISTLDSYGKGLVHEFFMKRTLKEEKQLELTVFTKNGSEYQEAKNNILIDKAITLVNFMRVDLNFDGKLDYFVHTLAEEDGKKFFQFSFYDSELNPLWTKFQDVRLTLDLYLESMNDISFMRYEHPTLGAMMVPAFFTVGQLPKVDQNITSWERYDALRKKRLYYLEPQNNSSFIVRSLTTNTWEDSLKKELKSKWTETVETEQLLPVSQKDAEAGSLRVLVSIGQSSRRSLFIHTFNVKRNTHGSKLPQLVLQSDYIDPLLSITSNGIINDGDVFFNIYDRTRAKQVLTQDESQLGQYVLEHSTQSDLIAGHISTFLNENDKISVYQSREELITIKNDGVKSKRAKLRYSFLSQKLLSEMYFPVSYKREGSLRPALYVDSTAVTGNRVYLFEEQDGVLVSSIRNSLIIPNNCRALNPNFSTEKGSHEFIFLCLEEKEFVIRSFELN